LLRLLTVLVKQTRQAVRAVKQSILLRCLWIFPIKTKNDTFRGWANRAKMMSLGGKLTALTCHLTKKVNKAEELTYTLVYTMNNKTTLVSDTTTVRH
jgi:hypothetical protein